MAGSTTGDAVDPGTDPAIKAVRPLTNEELRLHDRKMTIRSVIIAAASLFMGAVTTGATMLIFVDNRVAAQTAQQNKVQESRITALEQQVPQLRQEVFENRLDTRALYGAVMEKKRSARLEKPLAAPVGVDGGTLNGE